MWSSDRRAFILGAFALSACGFEPVYGPKGPLSQIRNQVLVQAPKDADEFHLVAAFENRLGQPTNKNYTLRFDLSIEEKSVVVDFSQELRRFNVNGILAFSLENLAGEKVVASKVEAFTAYSASGSTVATATARKDARKRLMTILADQTVTYLSAHLPE